MAVLNPPRVLPGLGRSMVNFLMESQRTWDEPSLIDAFIPPGVTDSSGAHLAVTNTLSAFNAIKIIETKAGSISVAQGTKQRGYPFNRTTFRNLLLTQVLDTRRDGNPWSMNDEEALYGGARDLTRALSWFLAQDALGPPLSWSDNVESLQRKQFDTDEIQEWAITNDLRWGTFARWATALGMAVPMPSRKVALVPLPTLAVSGVLNDSPPQRLPIREFLDELAQQLPVLSGGSIRMGLTTRLRVDPDPGVQENTLDTSVAQVLRLLETRGQLAFETLADAEGVRLSQSDENRITHITLKPGRMR